MIDEQGQPLSDNALPSAPVAAPQDQQAQPATAAPPPTPASADKYAGKTPEELARILHDQETHVGKLGNEVGQLRQELEFYRNMVNQPQQAQFQPQPMAPMQPPLPPQPEDKGQAFDWDNPAKAVQNTVRNELGQFYRTIQTEQAAQSAPYAEFVAKSQAPHLFQGQENEVRNVIIQGIRSGMLHPQAASNPEMWKMAAWQLRGMKQGYAPGGTVNAVSPTSTEMPQGSRPPQGNVEPPALDDEARAMLKAFGKTEADAPKLLNEK